MLPAKKPQETNLRSLQVRIVLLSYLAYFFFYFGRKYFGVITPSLIEEGILTKNQIGLIQTSNLALYATGQFIYGALGDKWGPKILIFIGMTISGLSALAIGFSPIFGVILIAYSVNGLAQASGCPNSCKLISSWIPHTKRGRVMGFWMTCYLGGSLAANTLAGYLVGNSYTWKHAVFINGTLLIIIGIIEGALSHQLTRGKRSSDYSVSPPCEIFKSPLKSDPTRVEVGSRVLT